MLINEKVKVVLSLVNQWLKCAGADSDCATFRLYLSFFSGVKTKCFGCFCVVICQKEVLADMHGCTADECYCVVAMIWFLDV